MSFTPKRYTTPVIKKNRPDDSIKFRPLPKPSGSYPFHLQLHEIKPVASEEKMVFHMVGDTGSVLNSDFQKVVAKQMIKQFDEAEHEEDKPQFLYHLGDLVYKFGEAEEYETQFFYSYNNYPAPVFAIAGNHDGDVNPDNPVPYKSLDAFRAVFCDNNPRVIPFSSTGRLSMVQPNVYWTLKTPLATFVGLYSNVPKYGMITGDQKQWFVEELRLAGGERPGKAIIICLHHAPFSADTNHSSSLEMIEFLENAFEETGVYPDIVFSGHVHNYQRFEKRFNNQVDVPFIVAGGGGYDELHSITLTHDENFTNDHPALKNVALKAYCEDKHGFLKMAIERKEGNLAVIGEYYSIAHDRSPTDSHPAALEDRFEIVRSAV